MEVMEELALPDLRGRVAGSNPGDGPGLSSYRDGKGRGRAYSTTAQSQVTTI
jgi:hypothetical protein